MTHPLPTVAPDTERLRTDAANFMQHNTDDHCRRMCRVGVDDLAVLLAWVAQFPTSASQQAAVSTASQPGNREAVEPSNPPLSADSGVREALAEVRDLLRHAREATNKISNARRKIGPLATQAQTASHALARADAILQALSPAQDEVSPKPPPTMERT